jgi:TonB family protein
LEYCRLGTPDVEVVPIVRKNPFYPRYEARQGIEGSVTLKGEIDAAGWVRNPEVVEANPPEVFDASELRAFSQWRYCPAADPNTPPRPVKVVIRFAKSR